MFTVKNKKYMRSLFSVFALATLLTGAGIANAQVVRNTLHNFVDVGGNLNRTDFTTLAFPAAAGSPIRWRTTGNPANPAPGAAFQREFDYGVLGSATVQGDSIVVADYTGDNKSEVAVWRDQATANGQPGVFYVSQFPTGTGGITLERAVPFGTGFSDVPGVQGDYDGDGKDDYAVVRVVGSGLVWYIMNSVNSTVKAISFGSLTGQTGVAVFPGADFNADGRDELIVISRNAAGNLNTFFIGDANTGQGVITRSFGNYNTDYTFAPEDYTGDGRADFLSSRQTDGANQTFYLGNSQNTTIQTFSFGIADPLFAGDGDSPVRGDFDGDGRHDICVWRPSNQTFYYISSQFSNIQSQKAGAETDFPIGSFGLY